MDIKGKSNSLKIELKRNYFKIIGLSIVFLFLLFCSVTSFILAVKANWNVIYLFLIVAVIFGFLLFKRIFWEVFGFWKISIEENVLDVEKNYFIFKNSSTYSINSNDFFVTRNLDNVQFIKIFPLGKLYLDIISKIDKKNWSVVLIKSESEKTIASGFFESEAAEIVSLLERK